jgi:hypothetical protein
MYDHRLPTVAVPHTPAAAVGIREILIAARDLCAPVLVVPKTVAEDQPGLVVAGSRLARVVVAADDRVVDAVVAQAPDGVVTFDDGQLENADAARVLLGLPGAPTVEAPWDKLTQRTRLRRGGVSTLAAEPVDDPDDLRRAIELVGLPGVLKRRRGVSGLSMRFLLDETDLRRELTARSEWSSMLYEPVIPSGDHPSGHAWLADYVSVETISDARSHRHVAVLGKTPLSVSRTDSAGQDFAVRETGDVFPSLLPATVYEEVLRKTSAALDALGVQWRVTHAELRATADLVEVIEVNGRNGGWSTAAILDAAAGTGVVRAALSTALGLPADVEVGLPGHIAHLIPPFPVRHGLVRSDVARADVMSLPGVFRVDFVARHGDPRAATAYRVAGVQLRAGCVEELGGFICTTVQALCRLFAEDDLGADEYARTMLANRDADVDRTTPRQRRRTRPGVSPR